MISTRDLLKNYEKELLPLLYDKEEYLKNHVTHKAVHEEGWREKFDKNREAHIKLLNSKLAVGPCKTCLYLGFECSCRLHKNFIEFKSNKPAEP